MLEVDSSGSCALAVFVHGSGICTCSRFLCANSEHNSSMDPISAQKCSPFAPIRGPWTIACSDTGSMDGIWGKNAGIIIHGLDFCTQSNLSCTNIGSMDDSGGPTCADISSMDDSGGTMNANARSMCDLDVMAYINIGLVDDGVGEPV